MNSLAQESQKYRLKLRNGIYHLRKWIPKSERGQYGVTEINRSLKTNDLHEAHRRAQELLAAYTANPSPSAHQ